MSITVEVTQGAGRYVWANLTERNGALLTTDTIRVSMTPKDTGIHDWLVPDDLDSVSASNVRVAVLVDDRFTPGVYHVRVKVPDNPEVEFVEPDNSLVTVR